MSDNQTFFGALETAIAEKTENLNAKVLPGVLSNFQLLHTCVKNMYAMLVQRALIKPDPYKLEKKNHGNRTAGRIGVYGKRTFHRHGYTLFRL